MLSMSESITITESGTYDLSTNKIHKLIIKADKVLIKNLKMNKLDNKSVQLLGNDITLSNCSFSECRKGEQFIQVKGQRCRITNCVFERFNEKGVCICISVYKNKEGYCLIDNCNFRDMKEGTSNGWEVIRIGDSKSSLYDSKSMIYNNFFTNCDREIELISVKSCSNIISFNKIIDCKSGIVLRHGRRNKVINNYIHGNYRKGCCGIRIIGKGHIIKYNTIEGIINKENPFRTAIAVLCGEENNKLNGYEPVKDTQITYNDILGCEVAFSIGVHCKRGKQVLPEKLLIEGNKVVKCNFTFNDDPKCLGAIKSFIDNNHIIDKDIKIETKKGEDIKDNVELINFYQQINMIQQEMPDSEDEEKDIIIVDKEEDKDDINFKDMLNEIERLREEEENSKCEKCDTREREINLIHKEYQQKIDKLLHEQAHYKAQLSQIKKYLFN